MNLFTKIKNLVLEIIPESAHNKYRILKFKHFGKAILKKWEKNGKPLPPPHVFKQNLIKEFQKESGIKILVETGTYMGDMVCSMIDVFEKIYTVELSKDLYVKTQKRFKNYDKVKQYNGDSGEMIINILKNINEPAIFWLDSHYSGGITAKGKKDTPILEELLNILKYSQFNHIILIDDARCFDGSNDYPTLDELKGIISKYNITFDFKIAVDVICLVIKNA